MRRESKGRKGKYRQGNTGKGEGIHDKLKEQRGKEGRRRGKVEEEGLNEGTRDEER